MSLAFLFYFSNYGATPPVTPPVSTADIGPGDYSTIRKYFPLKGEIQKPKLLKKTVVKKIKRAAKVEPSREQIAPIIEQAIPNISPDFSRSLDLQALQAAVNAAIADVRAQMMKDAAAEALNRAEEEMRAKVMIEGIRQYAALLEQDELLTWYVM